MDYKHTCDTIYTHFQGITNNIYGFGRPFFLHLNFVTRPPIFRTTSIYSFLPVHIFVFTRPNGRWTGLYIKLCSIWSPLTSSGRLEPATSKHNQRALWLNTISFKVKSNRMYANAVETKAVCNMDNMYQYCALTHTQVVIPALIFTEVMCCELNYLCLQ